MDSMWFCGADKWFHQSEAVERYRLRSFPIENIFEFIRLGIEIVIHLRLNFKLIWSDLNLNTEYFFFKDSNKFDSNSIKNGK